MLRRSPIIAALGAAVLAGTLFSGWAASAHEPDRHAAGGDGALLLRAVHRDDQGQGHRTRRPPAPP